jgi:hypothetical protein
VSATDSAAEARPALRIVRGDPTPEELAVLTALVTASETTTASPTQRPSRGHWTDPRLLVRRQLYPGPGAWRVAVWG